MHVKVYTYGNSAYDGGAVKRLITIEREMVASRRLNLKHAASLYATD